MKHSIKLINTLTDIALQNFLANNKPDTYACTAAYMIAKSAAAEFCRETADAASFVASAQDATEKIKLSQYSAVVVESAMKLHHAEKNFQFFSMQKPLEEKTSDAVSFEPLTSQIATFNFGDDAQNIYTSNFKEEKSKTYQLALVAAQTNYAHAYACSRAAYTHAVAIAARYPAGEKRNTAFKRSLASRLTSDVQHQPIEPGFFMQIICHPSIHLLAATLLATGLIALSIGVGGLMITAIDLTITSVGMSSMSLTVAGAAMTGAGGGIFASRFFTERKWELNNEKSHKAVEAMNLQQPKQPIPIN